MTPAEVEAETRAAVKALVHRLQNHGDTDLSGADAEPFAVEFMTALKGRGWRPTPARPSPDWRQQGGHGGNGPTGEYLAEKAKLLARGGAPGVPGQGLSPENKEAGR